MKKFSPIKERMRQYLDFKKIKISEAYRRTGMIDGTLSNRSGITEDNIAKFFRVYDDINPEWLLSGKGDMMLNPDIEKPRIENYSHSERYIRFLEVQVQEKDKQLRAKDEQISTLIKELKRAQA